MIEDKRKEVRQEIEEEGAQDILDQEMEVEEVFLQRRSK